MESISPKKKVWSGGPCDSILFTQAENAIKIDNLLQNMLKYFARRKKTFLTVLLIE